MTNRLESATPAARDLTCAQCGTAFSCGLSTACWCAEETARLPLPGETSAADCLCPGCLRNLAGIPAPLKAVLLDMDGTLLDTERVNLAALSAAMDEFGYPGFDDLGPAMVGVPAPECEAMLLQRFGDDFPLEAFDAAFVVHRDRLLVGGMPLKPGVTELLDHFARERVPMAVVTSSSRRSANRYLALAGIGDHFAAVVTRDDVARGKPGPEPYLHAARLLGVDPRDCLAIEDSPTGAASAHAAGIVTLLVPDMLEPGEATRRKVLDVLPDLHAVLKLLT